VWFDVVARERIGRPPEVVAAYEFEPANDPTWIGGVRTSERVSEGQFGVGWRVRRGGGFLGRPIARVMNVVSSSRPVDSRCTPSAAPS
jgi:hypothetical protein